MYLLDFLDILYSFCYFLCCVFLCNVLAYVVCVGVGRVDIIKKLFVKKIDNFMIFW